MTQGIYEEIVTKLVSSKLSELDIEKYYIKKTPIDKTEASSLLSKHLSKTIHHAFSLLSGEDVLEHQIEIANKIILFLKE